MNQSFARHIHFESVPNFRDMGGYRTHDGHTVAWRRLFRSAALHPMTERDIGRFKQDIGPRAVLDLRSPEHADKEREIEFLSGMGARHYHIPFRPDGSGYMKTEAEAHPNATNLGQIYLYRISEKAYGERLVDALEIIADRNNHPLVVHCTVGKDRTGVLAAMLLAAVGVTDEGVIEDYTLSGSFMPAIRERMPQEVKDLPDYQWEATAESMSLFLAAIRREYGSAEGYLMAQGADGSLTDRLKQALLI